MQAPVKMLLPTWRVTDPNAFPLESFDDCCTAFNKAGIGVLNAHTTCLIQEINFRRPETPVELVLGPAVHFGMSSLSSPEEVCRDAVAKGYFLGSPKTMLRTWITLCLEKQKEAPYNFKLFGGTEGLACRADRTSFHLWFAPKTLNRPTVGSQRSAVATNATEAMQVIQYLFVKKP